MKNTQIQYQSPARDRHDFSNQIKKLIQYSPSSISVQITMIVFFISASFFSNLQLKNSHLLYMNPSFFCEGSSQKQTQAYACQIINHCQIINKESATSELQLYCGQKTQGRILIQTSVSLGNWLGILFVSLVSDILGRKFCFILGLLCLNACCLVQFIGINWNITVFLVVSQVLTGFCGKIMYVSFLIISTRFLQKGLYQSSTIGWLLVPGLTQVFISILNSYFHSWRIIFYIYSLGIFILSLTSFFIIYQDPVFYFDSRKYEECKAIFQEVGKKNSQNSEQIAQKIQQLELYITQRQEYYLLNDNQLVSSYNVYELRRSDILGNILILSIVGCCSYISGESIDFSIQSLKLSYNQNLFIVGASTAFGFLTASTQFTIQVYLIKVEDNRKRGLFLSSILCGLTGLMFAFKFCSDYEAIESVCISVLKIGLCWVGTFFVRLKVDPFPQKYQALLIGIIEAMTNFGKTLGPTITQAAINNQFNPIFLASLLYIVGGTFIIYFIKQKKIILKEQVQNKEISSHA